MNCSTWNIKAKKDLRIVLTAHRNSDCVPVMNLPLVMEIAKRNLDTSNGSANLCFADSQRVLARGYPFHAAIHAMKSLAYSVGILHPDYAEAWKASGQEGEPRSPGFMWSQKDVYEGEFKAMNRE